MHKLKGEYWLHGDDVSFADGDVGETNHEGYALDYLRRGVLDTLGVAYLDYYDWDGLLSGPILDELRSRFETEEDDDASYLLLKHAEALGLDDMDVAHALGTVKYAADVRSYMAERYGWVAVWDSRFCVHALTRETAERIAEGASRIAEEQGIEPGEDAEINIFVATTGKTYRTTLTRLEEADWSDLPIEEVVPAVGPNAQVAAMDREIQHPYYKGAHV